MTKPFSFLEYLREKNWGESHGEGVISFYSGDKCFNIPDSETRISYSEEYYDEFYENWFYGVKFIGKIPESQYEATILMELLNTDKIYGTFHFEKMFKNKFDDNPTFNLIFFEDNQMAIEKKYDCKEYGEILSDVFLGQIPSTEEQSTILLKLLNLV